MEFEHEFTVPVPIDEAWKTLLDVERVAPCMPGATLDSVEGDAMAGRVKVKIGPITMTYQGTARFEEKDETDHHVVFSASGRETRGTGTARATVRTQLHDAGDHTRVVVATSLAVTGRPAQFGRSVMQEVGGKLVSQFAQGLATEVLSGGAAARGETAATPETSGGAGAAPHGASSTAAVTTDATTASAGTPVPTIPDRTAEPTADARTQPATMAGESASRPSPEVIDLLGTAGAPVLRRLVPVAGAVVVVGLVIWWLARR